jgi:hypothetical protein
MVHRVASPSPALKAGDDLVTILDRKTPLLRIFARTSQAATDRKSHLTAMVLAVSSEKDLERAKGFEPFARSNFSL